LIQPLINKNKNISNIIGAANADTKNNIKKKGSSTCAKYETTLCKTADNTATTNESKK
jgi:hypothetical protein